MSASFGTSPRARGKPFGGLIILVDYGNIPAYAGKTVKLACHVPARSEHPRVCGENPGVSLKSSAICGTSPRMRGKLPLQWESFSGRRNIPAYAGKTTTARWRVVWKKEHPRVCGENVSIINLFANMQGTSPRMRGKPLVRRGRSPGRRNIPAYAGKTIRQQRGHHLKKEHPRVCGENQRLSCPRLGRAGTSPRMRGKRSLG